ncbi:hypothetical protein [Usitatibacter palustris]|uniref:Uncharacterized protein n=1 Tax=Usitatibacter palustris TaxID=2732487 RepID=A0A6M4H9R6_9PROT|nr:hypothetical protein [Usitatibacter palustris]QJR15925.1 hypothetical protein DSM104440_02752 [Usitatibacter palustris]
MSAFAEALQRRNVKAVYFVDDGNATPRIRDVDEAIEATAQIPPRRLKNLIKKDERFAKLLAKKEEVSELPREEQRSELKPLVELLVEEHSLASKDFDLMAEVFFQGQKYDVLEKLKLAVPEGLLHSFTFGDWLKRGTEIVKNTTADSRILVLLDEVNDREKDVPLDGLRALVDLWKNHSDSIGRVDVIVVTSNCEPTGEFDEAKRLLEDLRQALQGQENARSIVRAFVLSKGRFNGRRPLDEDLLAHMNRLDATDLRGELIRIALAEMTSAVRESVSWLEQIPLSEFHGSIFISADNEGTSEVDVLMRLVNLKQRAALESNLKKGPLREQVEKMRRFSLRAFDAEQAKFAKSELKDLRVQEFERPGSHVNGMQQTLACGDVFEITFEDGEAVDVILLANPCDVAIRPDGQRKLQRGWLVKMERLAVRDLAGKQGTPPLVYRIATGESDEDIVYVFNNSSVDSIDLGVLDWCWTNPEGRAACFPKQIRDGYSFLLKPQHMRLRSLEARIARGGFCDLELWGKKVASMRSEVEVVTIDEMSFASEIVFPISRKWRMSVEFANAALAGLAQAIARPAFGHDFSRVDYPA